MSFYFHNLPEFVHKLEVGIEEDEGRRMGRERGERERKRRGGRSICKFNLFSIQVFAIHLVELPLPFFVFGNSTCRAIAFVGTVGMNAAINITGNFGFLGIMSCVECIFLLGMLWLAKKASSSLIHTSLFFLEVI
jgi:hypothetical protein